MEVKIYREPENEALIMDEKSLAEYNELIAELGINAPVKEEKTPNVYTYLNSAMTKQLHALCPMKIKVEEYTKSTIPLDVLKVLQYCKGQEMFDGYQIWWDDTAPDPLLIGWKWENEEVKKNNYTWRVDRYLIARWGDCAMEIPELLEKGFERIKQELIDKANASIETCNSVLKNPNMYVRKILNNEDPTISLSTSASGTVY